MIRKCDFDGSRSHDFKYPMKVGSKVKAPDWNPDQVCGGGLHGLEDANGDWNLLDGDTWQVISYLEKDRVKIDTDKVKIRRGVVEYVGKGSGLIDFVNQGKLNPINESAVWWNRHIGDRDIMIKRVKTPMAAVHWGRLNLNDLSIMIKKITTSESAYYWAVINGDHNKMMKKITSSSFAYYWASRFGDRKVMVKKINAIKWASKWIQAGLGYERHLYNKFPTLKQYIERE